MSIFVWENRKMKLIKTLCVIAGFASQTLAVQGDLIDFWGRPIVGATVSWSSNSTQTTSDSMGYFNLLEASASVQFRESKYLQASSENWHDLLGRAVSKPRQQVVFASATSPRALLKTGTLTLVIVKSGFSPETLSVNASDSLGVLPLRHLVSVDPQPFTKNIFQSFQTGSSAELAKWTPNTTVATSTYDLVWDASRNDSVLHIHNAVSNHFFFSKNICGLLPTRHYVFSGYMKGSNVVNTEQGLFGVTIGSNNDRSDYRFSQGAISMGTFDWRLDTAIVETGNDGCVDLMLALGNRYNVATGDAWFDDLSLDGPIPAIAAPGFVVHLTPSQQQLIDSSLLYRWAEQLGRMVAGYVRIAGPSPVIQLGETASLVSTHAFLYGLVSGNPFNFGIRSMDDAIVNRIGPWNDLTFGAIHEMGHNFACTYWGFAGEMQANFLASLVLDSMPHALVYQEGWGGHYYAGWGNMDYTLPALDTASPALLSGTGTNLKRNPPVPLIHLFKGSHDQYVQGKATLNWDAIQYKFMLMTLDPRIGWKAFQKAFWGMHTKTASATQAQRLLDFLQSLHEASTGSWVDSEFFTPAERTWMSANFN